MSLKKIILFPFGGNAKEAITVIEAINRENKIWEIQGFIDDNPDLKDKEYLGFKVIGGREKLSDDPSALVLAVPGRAENYFMRKEIILSLDIPLERFAILIHPSSSVSPSTAIGQNTLIMAGVTTTVNVQVGNHCVILPNSVISHDVIIEDCVLVGSNVSVSGNVHIEESCYIGSGAKIIQEVVIGKGALIGMGTNVLSSVEPGSVVVGNPGKIIRKVK